MANLVKLYVESPDELLNAGAYDVAALMRVQSCATETGVYADIAGTGSTPTITLVTATRAYTAYDPAGASVTWYKTRYENLAGTRLSDWSAAFQVGDETAGRLCSIYDVKQRLGILFSDSTDDEILAELIDQVSDEITSITGRSFAPDPLSGTKTVYLDSVDYGRTIRLPRGVRSVSYLGVAGTDQPETGGTYTEITSAYYYLDPPAHERSNGWPATRITLGTDAPAPFYSARRGVKITGAFGFAAVPAAVRAIAEMLVVSAYRARGSGGANTYTIGVEGERTYQRLLTTKDLVTLRWYADINV